MAVKMSRHALNILRVYHRAHPLELHSGLTWYANAAEEIEARLPVERRTGCGVVAALSPQTAWERNIYYAELLCGGVDPPSTGARIALARSIFHGADPVAAVRGPKTSAFLACLLDQSTDAVCVDGHAYSVWLGRRVATSAAPCITPKLHGIIAADYRVAADAVGIAPHAMQATTWEVWRRIHPRTKSRRPDAAGQRRFLQAD
jgi:hypothetical protein